MKTGIAVQGIAALMGAAYFAISGRWPEAIGCAILSELFWQGSLIYDIRNGAPRR